MAEVAKLPPAGDMVSEDAKRKRAIASKYRRGLPIATKKIDDRKLRGKLRYTERVVGEAQASAAAAEEWLLPDGAGALEAEGLERTWQFSQEAIVGAVESGAAAKAFDLDLTELGPYAIDVSRDGRFLALGGAKGHLALVDRLAVRAMCEVQVRESVRSVAILHSHSFFAAAQKKYTYIYDKRGIEIHCLKEHTDVEALAYLPHHFLLASASRSGALAWQDTSTGRIVAQTKTRSGPPGALAVNPTSGVLALGSAPGTVSLWTPNQNAPVLKMLCHHGPVRAAAWHPSGNILVTAGADCAVKVWDVRALRPMHAYFSRAAPVALDVSQKGLLAVAAGRGVQVWRDGLAGEASGKAQSPYLTHTVAGGSLSSAAARFVPYDDVLALGHAGGVSAILVPGAGEPNYDSFVADPYAGRKARREGEVAALLDKIQPEMIVLDPDSIGAVQRAPADVQKEAAARAAAARAEATAEQRAKADGRTKMKGKNKPSRRARRKQQNVIEDRKPELRERLRAQGLSAEHGMAAARDDAEAKAAVPRALRGFVGRRERS